MPGLIGFPWSSDNSMLLSLFGNKWIDFDLNN